MTDWYMEGPWVRSCNCDFRCLRDLNAQPTRGYCEGMMGDAQRDALFCILSGRHGDTIAEIMAAICPTVHEPVIADFQLEVDPATRSARVAVGEA
ncbi:MAG: hypothetical protein C4305_06525 [Thermoleophilia bacterium]